MTRMIKDWRDTATLKRVIFILVVMLFLSCVSALGEEADEWAYGSP